MITSDLLKQTLSYDRDTGYFYWETMRRAHRVKNGSIAGTKGKNGYIQICINRKLYYAHRLAFLFVTGEFPSGEVDHIDHNRSNNKWCNLRDCNRSENQRNVSIGGTNRSGFIGVSYSERKNQYRAYIGHEGKAVHLGWFDRKGDAISARIKANTKYRYHENHGIKEE